MLRCISPYRSSMGQFQVGEIITDPDLAAALLVDSPGSFEAVTEANDRAMDAPPADRMMRPARKRATKAEDA